MFCLVFSLEAVKLMYSEIDGRVDPQYSKKFDFIKMDVGAVTTVKTVSWRSFSQRKTSLSHFSGARANLRDKTAVESSAHALMCCLWGIAARIYFRSRQSLLKLKLSMNISKLYFLISMLYIEATNEPKENRHFTKYRARKYWSLSGCEHVPRKLFIFL